MRRPHVSAALFLDQLKLAQELVGADAVARALASLRPDQRAEIEALLPVSWCGVDTSEAFFHAVARATDQDPIAWHRKITRVGIERTFTTLWRFLLRMATIESILKRVSSLYSHSYDTGKMTAELSAPGHIVGVVCEWPHIPEFEIDALTSGIEVLIHLAGHRTTSVTWKRLPDGVRFDIRFE